MFVSNQVKPIERVQKNGMSQQAQSLGSFHNILNRKLKNRLTFFSSTIEITGILIPCYQKYRGQTYRFKLATQAKEYLVLIKFSLSELAKKATWDEVTMKGVLSDDSKVFKVEKITLKPQEENEMFPVWFREPSFDVDMFTRLIGQKGKLEPEPDYLAS